MNCEVTIEGDLKRGIGRGVEVVDRSISVQQPCWQTVGPT